MFGLLLWFIFFNEQVKPDVRDTAVLSSLKVLYVKCRIKHEKLTMNFIKWCNLKWFTPVGVLDVLNAIQKSPQYTPVFLSFFFFNSRPKYWNTIESILKNLKLIKIVFYIID